ncbi:MAG: hypothetical protein GY832_04945, partial [Chloroflexi bacterium]|nr:hypothetical protein [Chloroflexota bacterium]
MDVAAETVDANTLADEGPDGGQPDASDAEDAAVAGNDVDSSGLALVAATELGVLETSAWIRGRDGGYSGVFEGRSVWLYGDTTLHQP